MTMKKYRARVRFIFDGTIDVNAEDKMEAYEYLEKHVGFCLGGDIHTTLSNDEIPTWYFSVHPDKIITNLKLR